jgi:hypothetical protein
MIQKKSVVPYFQVSIAAFNWKNTIKPRKETTHDKLMAVNRTHDLQNVKLE